MEHREQGTEVYLSEVQGLRSVFFFFNGAGAHQFDAGVIKPYSFELVNTSAHPLLNGKETDDILIPGVVVGGMNSLAFPSVGYYTRNDVLDFNFGLSPGTSYIRAEIWVYQG